MARKSKETAAEQPVRTLSSIQTIVASMDPQTRKTFDRLRGMGCSDDILDTLRRNRTPGLDQGYSDEWRRLYGAREEAVHELQADQAPARDEG